jgi:hypothetical protein
MTRLEMKKASSDMAFASVALGNAGNDADVAAKAAELQLTDPLYQQFKNDAGFFRQQYLQAKQADDADAKANAAKVPAAVPAAPAVVKAPGLQPKA